jgi:hypothetical protein
MKKIKDDKYLGMGGGSTVIHLIFLPRAITVCWLPSSTSWRDAIRKQASNSMTFLFFLWLHHFFSLLTFTSISAQFFTLKPSTLSSM